MSTEILAKSDPPETLLLHTRNCLAVFCSVRVAMPHLPQICGRATLWRDLFLSIYLHDLGKAATGFQEMLKDGDPWRYRHEILSAGFVPFLDSIVDEPTRKAISLAVITHHRTTSDLAGTGKRQGFNTVSSATGKEQWQVKRAELLPNWDFVCDWLAQLPAVADEFLGETVATPRVPASVDEVEDAYRRAVHWFNRACNDDDPVALSLCGPYAIFLRGLVVACDHLASGGRLEVLPAIEDLGARLSFEPRPFQRKAEKTPGNLLLSAPTGSGKTEAALLWANAQQDAGRRLFYVLPYTASINAMLHRLQDKKGLNLGQSVGALHGKANYFAYQDLCEHEYLPANAAREAKERGRLSRGLYRPLKIVTPFQIIKAFFGSKGWETQMAEFAGGLFIWDEIHVYDARTTALLLTALEKLTALGAKSLFMSATFPTFLRAEIERIVPDLTIQEPDLNEAEDRRLWTTPRHRVERLEGEIFGHLDAIRAELADGKSVLVVCNTVARAQDVFSELEEAAKSAELLHGRFILRDREAIERRLDKTQLLVGTQAVEVSLDLDFSTIFTEPAPIDALIQRFGRVNRKGKKGVVPVRIVEVGGKNDRYFYDLDRIERTLNVLVDGEELTQQKVAAYVNQVYEGGYNANEQAEFDAARSSFARLIRDLRPFDASPHEDEFYELIRSVQVVPQEFATTYQTALEEKQPFEAMQYVATITLGQGMKLRNQNALVRREFQVGNRTLSFLVAQCKYDERKGLLLDLMDDGGVMI